MADALIGQKLGQYEIQLVLGKGGMSTVYLGFQPSMERTVAIKVLPREFMHDDTFLIRFQQEVKTVVRLEHPHILPVYDAGEADGIPYIVMRYVSGGTLADLLNRDMPTYDTIVRVAEQVGAALDYAHEHDVIHRDLKPSNILLDERGNAYLSDFGIARSAAQSLGLTGSRVIGTPPYVAPEMIRKGETVTGLADLYGLGIITYEMLTGELPYRDPDPTVVLMAHVLEPVPSVRTLNPAVHPEIDAVVRRCLAKSPRERQPRALDYAQDLARAVKLAQNSKAPLASSPALSRPITPAGDPISAEFALDRLPDEEEAPRQSGAGFGCLVTMGVIAALAAGVFLTALYLTNGDIASLFTLFSPASGGGAAARPTAGPTPTVTPQGGGSAEEPADPASDPPVVLPPPGGGARLAFTSNRDGDFEIYLIDLDGANLRKITDNETIQDFDPAWSPDGLQLAYASRTEDQEAEVWTINADGSDPRRLTENAATDFDPDWSPNGAWIAFASNRGGDFELWAMRPDGSDPCPLTSLGQTSLTPRWSPDGERLAFHARKGSDREGSELYLMEVNQDSANCEGLGRGAPIRLTANGWRDQWPDWSPDGLKLVYTSSEGRDTGQQTIFVLNLLDNNVQPITSGSDDDDDPAWSPDGTMVAFDSNRNGNGFFDIFILNIQTGQVSQLTFEAADDVVPRWQPGN